jgi:hypothetical protein
MTMRDSQCLLITTVQEVLERREVHVKPFVDGRRRGICADKKSHQCEEVGPWNDEIPELPRV